MERDDEILRALTDGPAGSAELAERTGLSLSAVKRGLRHLVEVDYVFAPVRGTYRLTSRGRAVSPAPTGSVSPVEDRPLDLIL